MLQKQLWVEEVCKRLYEWEEVASQRSNAAPPMLMHDRGCLHEIWILSVTLSTTY